MGLRTLGPGVKGSRGVLIEHGTVALAEVVVVLWCSKYGVYFGLQVYIYA